MRISRNAMAESPSGNPSELIPPRAYSGLNEDDCQLRMWLPEPAKLALEEVCEIHETSMTAYLTEYFVSYLYGYHELLRMRSTKTGLYEPKPIRRGCAMQPSGVDDSASYDDVAPNLGKNIFALKIWVPDTIKTDLQKRAELAQVTLGELLRSLICTHCFGREYGPNRLMALSDGLIDAEVASAWEGVDLDDED